eukprot:maker-scaffold2630_size13758-snap-gene-0.3 protein:Tk02374 transcript:maker-scaffold2630_size13758-snap-gene-0.3-mRNA-1 annotation:"hypothetical protein H311_02490"
MAKDIQIDWANFHRDICGQHLLKNPTVIGGVQEDENGTSTPVIVEIDESLLAKAKYNLGRWPEQRWVFGGVERQTGHCFMVEVPDRRRETLEAEIKGFIRPGTQILSDGWAAYNKVDEFAGGNYTHSVIVHEHNFVDPNDPTIHTQQIEGHCYCTGPMAQWESGGNVVGVLAFDTVDKAQLIPKLAALGIKGTALSWYDSYFSCGRQCVDWSWTRSSFAHVTFGVRQGSILGPCLFLVLMADLPDCLRIGEECNVDYADDVSIWAVGKDLPNVKSLLNQRAEGFARFAAGNGLIMNTSKTQLLLGGKVRRADLEDFHVVVDGVTVFPDKKLELLGVKFDSSFSTFPHGASVAASARQRAAMIARLSHHLPRGAYLQQLARGLVLGKRAGLSSLNELTVHAVAMETWRWAGWLEARPWPGSLPLQRRYEVDQLVGGNRSCLTASSLRSQHPCGQRNRHLEQVPIPARSLYQADGFERGQVNIKIGPYLIDISQSAVDMVGHIDTHVSCTAVLHPFWMDGFVPMDVSHLKHFHHS